MQDIRLRTGAAAVLSLAAFSGIPGAVLVFIWWLVFSQPARVLKKIRILVPALVIVAFFGLVLEATGGGGYSYTLRMTVIILVGAWLCGEYRQGEFLALGTWLAGEKTGFDCGLVAETGMQSLDLLVADLSRIRHAYQVKGIRWGLWSIVPAGSILVHGALRHAGETAELMATRGYSGGGSYCPVFAPSRMDIVAGIAAVCIGIIAFVPVSEFFILYH
jgi:energy-coupling factor transport system permease protein